MRKNTVILFSLFLSFCISLFPEMLNAQSDRYTGISKLNSGYWVKIRISESGIYQISYADLRAWGFVDPAKVKLYGYGGAMLPEDFQKPYIDDLPEVPVMRYGERMIFYAQGVVKWTAGSSSFTHERNPYSQYGYYFLSENDDQPRTMETVAANESTSATTVNVFNDYALHEQELINLGRTGRKFYGEDFIYEQIRTFTFDIPGITETPVSMQIDFVVKALAANSNTIAGKIKIKHNDVALSESSQDRVYAILNNSQEATYASGRSTSSTKTWVRDPNNPDRITIQFEGSQASTARLDFIRLNMERDLKIYDGIVAFRNLKARNTLLKYAVNISGSSDPRIWDITDLQNPVSIESSLHDGCLWFVPQSVGLKEYVAFDAARTFPSPEYVGIVSNQNLHGYSRADLVIIVPPEFYSQAERLGKFHESEDDMSYLIVYPEQIYNEFSSGTPDATAYRRFMKMFYDRAEGNEDLRPRYLLLFGDGTYDNRLITSEWQGYKYPFLLTFQSESSLDERTSYVTDDYFGFLKDTDGANLLADKQDISIGRFPVRTLAEATVAVDKVIEYGQNKNFGVWKNNLCFVADDGNNSDHMELADELCDKIESKYPEFFPYKVYLDAYTRVSSASGGTYPDAKKRMFDLLDDGLLFINFCGHGSSTSWTAEKILEMSDIRKLYLKRLPLWITATCDFSRFDDKSNSGGEELFLNSKGGGIALFTTTRVVYMEKNAILNKMLIENIFERDTDGSRYRLGDVMRVAKKAVAEYVNSDGVRPYERDLNKLNFILLGDPALRLAYPEYKMVITEINGDPIDETSDLQTLKARSWVKMKGEVRDHTTGEKKEDFNGLVYPRLYDSKKEITTNGFESDVPFTFYERANMLYSGKDSVRNGEFEFEFKMPVELNYSSETGLLNLYGYDEQGREAQGSNEQFVVGDMDNDVEADTEGPIIHSMYLNSETFSYGDKVNEEPVFIADVEDESGINISGIGIGHNMTVTIDHSSAQEYIVNNYFDPVVGEFGRGTVMYQLPSLPAGSHTLTFKVWDTEGNSTEKTTSFVVVPGMKPQIFDLYPQKNPVSEYAEFYLKHDRPNMNIQLRLSIYNLMGTELWTYSDDGLSDMWTSQPIVWNLTDKAGRRVAPGVYLYRAYISTEGSKEATKTKKIIVVAQ